jgi:PEP-CTERM motif
MRAWVRMISAPGLATMLALGAVQAQSVPITGGLSFGGAATPTPGSDWDAATGVNFATPVDCDGGGMGTALCNATVTLLSQSGSYASVANGQAVVFQDFDFLPAFVANNPLWTFEAGGLTYSFSMNSVSVLNSDPNDDQLGLFGTGVVSITGFDPTPGDWNFTAQSAGGVTFSFSASTSAIPEPGSLLLLGLGLTGLAAAGRKGVR